MAAGVATQMEEAFLTLAGKGNFAGIVKAGHDHELANPDVVLGAGYFRLLVGAQLILGQLTDARFALKQAERPNDPSLNALSTVLKYLWNKDYPRAAVALNSIDLPPPFVDRLRQTITVMYVARVGRATKDFKIDDNVAQALGTTESAVSAAVDANGGLQAVLSGDTGKPSGWSDAVAFDKLQELSAFMRAD